MKVFQGSWLHMVACCWTVTSEDPSKAWWVRCSVGMKLRESWGIRGFTGDSDGKQSAWNAGEPGSIPGLDLLCFVFFFLLSTGKIQQLWSSSTCYSVVTTSHGVKEKNRGVSVCLIWSSVAFFLGAGREVSGPLNSVWPVTNRFSRNKHGHPCSPDSKP